MSTLRLLYIILFGLGGMGILLATINIQWIDGEEWRQRAEQREKSFQTVPARRGNIYSSDGNILATTIPECDLYLDLGRWAKMNDNGKPALDANQHPIFESLIHDTNFFKYIDSVCIILHTAKPSKSVNEFRTLITTERAKNKPSRYFLVARSIPYSYWMQICRYPGWRRAVVRQGVIHNVRAHTYGNLAENIIGFRNSRESDTYTGLEGYYNKYLRGQDGKFLCRRLTKGIWLPVDEGHQFNEDATVDSTMIQPIINGKHIVSTIDTRYQDIAESSLRQVLTQYGGQAGCAVLMEIKTGYVLACSNLALDTTTHTFREMPNRNVACSDIYEPGSTFKTIILTAMMNDTTIDTAERVRVGQKVFPGKRGDIMDSRGHEHVDTVSVRNVIAMSSNVGMCELGWKYYRNHRSKLQKSVMNIFPFEPLMLDLSTAESHYRINNLNASNRDFLNFCFGYSTMVSAMQVLTFYNAIGGNGRMVKPLFCKQVIDGHDTTNIEPIVLKERICSPHTASIIKDLLINVVENGTGNNIRNSAYGIAGKTGTAVHNYTNSSRYNASFSGFFPTENPKYSCIVVVQDLPINGRQSAIVFRDIANCVMAMDKSLGNISLSHKVSEMKNRRTNPYPFVVKGHQDELIRAYSLLQVPYFSSDSSARWTFFSHGVDSLNTRSCYKPYSLPTGKIPDCTGMTIKDAIHLLHSMGLNVKFTGFGKVVRQDPKGRTPYNKGTTVFLTLGNEPIE